MNKNIVIFKGIPNGILIILDKNAPFEDISLTLLEKMRNAHSFFSDANLSITFKGRELSENEEIQLLEIISKESKIDISFVNNLENKFKLTNSILKRYTLDDKNNFTHFHKGSLRSGQKIDFYGNVVILGDINPGAEIIAEANIIVLGKLKGVVRAGCKGNKNCFIFALHMMPTQLAIGDCLAYLSNKTKRKAIPEYAYVKNNKIFVEQLIKY